MKIPLLALLLQGIPEQTAMVALAFVIARIPLKWHKIILIAILLGFSAYVIRQFPFFIGFHTIIILFVLFIILTHLTKGDVALAFTASAVSVLALGVFEFFCTSLVMNIFGYTPETLFNDIVVRIVAGEPHVLLLFTSAFLLNKLFSARIALTFK